MPARSWYGRPLSSGLRMRQPSTFVEGRDFLQVEISREIPGRGARGGHHVPAFLDDLTGDDFLIVFAGDEFGVLEPRHHLVEGGPRPADAVPRQFAPQLAAEARRLPQVAEDEELEMGD